MKTALVIMAAGIGSRFGGGIKQLAAVGPNGEIIMDYSIHDAIEAGFDKIVFIIRHDIEEAFKEAIGDRIEKICAGLGVEIDYAFQHSRTCRRASPCQRDAPSPGAPARPCWPARALLKSRSPSSTPTTTTARSVRPAARLPAGYTPDKPGDLAMAGFVLKNTLSDNGAVTRGVCQMTPSVPDRCCGDFRH